MSRLSLLALALLSLPAAGVNAAIVFDPSPVPGPQCADVPTLNPYYQRQLQVLNRPYGSINSSYDPCSGPTVNIYQKPCPAADTNLYYRKGDLMPRVEYRRAAAPAAKGTILIIPKAFLDRPVKSFVPPKTA